MSIIPAPQFKDQPEPIQILVNPLKENQDLEDQEKENQ